MTDITATVRSNAISGTVGAASVGGTVVGQVPPPGAPGASVSGRVGANCISGSVGAASLVGIVTVGGGAAPAGDSWNGTW